MFQRISPVSALVLVFGCLASSVSVCRLRPSVQKFLTASKKLCHFELACTFTPKTANKPILNSESCRLVSRWTKTGDRDIGHILVSKGSPASANVLARSSRLERCRKRETNRTRHRPTARPPMHTAFFGCCVSFGVDMISVSHNSGPSLRIRKTSVHGLELFFKCTFLNCAPWCSSTAGPNLRDRRATH